MDGTMKNKPKKYPMDGPPLHVQRMMLNPTNHRGELKSWAKSNPNIRRETLEAIEAVTK
jgi:hypothetical protein